MVSNHFSGLFSEWREFCIDRLAFLNHQVSHWSQLYPSIIAHHARCCQGLRSQSLTTPPATSSTSPNSWMNIAASLLYSKVKLVMNRWLYVWMFSWFMKGKTYLYGIQECAVDRQYHQIHFYVFLLLYFYHSTIKNLQLSSEALHVPILVNYIIMG